MVGLLCICRSIAGYLYRAYVVTQGVFAGLHVCAALQELQQYLIIG